MSKQARELVDEISSSTELRHVDYDPISGGRITAHPPGPYEAWRERITEFIESLVALGD